MRWLFPLVLIVAPFASHAQETLQERTDRGTITAFIEDNLSGAGRQVVLRDFKGALSSRATASQLTIADDDGIWLTLNDITLDWSRSALLSGQVSITELTAAEIILDRLPKAGDDLPSPEASGFALPELPVSIKIDKIEAARVVLGETILGQQVEGSIQAAMSLSGGEGAGTLEIDRTDSGPQGRVDLSASFANATRTLVLSLEAVEDANGIAATLLNLPGKPSVDLSIKGDGPLSDFSADLLLKSDGEERLSGTATLLGEDDGATRFSADLAGDLAPLFLPAYADFLGTEISLSANGLRSAAGSLDLSSLDVQARSLEFKGRARIAADGLPEFLDLSGTLRDPDGKPVLVPGFEAGVSVRAAQLAVGYDLATGETWEMVVDGEGIATPAGSLTTLDLRGSGRIARQQGGNVIDGTFTATAAGLSPNDPALAQALGPTISAKTRVGWQEGSGSFQIESLGISAGPLVADAKGEIRGLAEGFHTSGTLLVKATDLSPLSGLAGRSLSGSGTITAKGQGSPLGGDFDVQARIDGQNLSAANAELDSLLRGPSSVAVDARRDTTGTTLRALSLRATGLAVDGKGTVSSNSADFDLTVQMDDLARLGPAYGGSLQGGLHLTGPLAKGQARIVADMSGRTLRVGVPEVDRLLNGASTVAFAADLNGDALTIEKFMVATPGATASATGLLAVAGSNLVARLSVADLSRLRAGLGGRITADASFKGTSQTASFLLTADAGNLRVGQAEVDRVLAGSSKLTAALRLENGLLRVDDLRLNSPQITAQATGRLAQNRREIDISARLANLGLLLSDFPGAVAFSGKAVDTGRGYDLSLSGTGPGGIDARVTGRVAANFGSADVAVRGSAQAGLANPFLGNRVISGPVSIDLRLNGPIALSALSGRIALSGGRLADPGVPFSLEAIDAAATLGGGRAVVDAAMNVSTGGRVTARGPIALTAPFAADLAVTVLNATLRDPQLYEARVNGDLRISGPLTGGATISGRIALPQTELRIAATGFGGAGSLDELRHLSEPAPVRETRRRAGLLGQAGTETDNGQSSRPYGLDIEISAPNQLFVRGRGLDAELGGTLRLTGNTNAIVPSGAFNLIRGRLNILGRRLTLTEASLQLEGDFDPLLRVVASSQNDGITSSVVIEGNVTDPQVTFTSSPELPQEEVLAQLLFGRRLDNLSALQALQLANAVATLAGRGGEGIIGKLRSGFGLDDLDVQTDADGNAQLTAGKYISEKVYSEVVVDQKGKSQINLNLDLTDSVTIKGRVGADGNTGIGLFYEKDY